MSIQKIHAREILDSRGNPTVEVDLHTARGNGRAKEEAWLPPPLQQVGLGPADPVSLGQVASGLRCPAGLPPASMKPWSCGMETKPGTWAKVRGEMGGGEIPLSKASGGVGSPHPWGKTNAGRRGQRKEEGNCTSDRMKLPLSGEAEGRLGGAGAPLVGIRCLFSLAETAFALYLVWDIPPSAWPSCMLLGGSLSC